MVSRAIAIVLLGAAVEAYCGGGPGCTCGCGCQNACEQQAPVVKEDTVTQVGRQVSEYDIVQAVAAAVNQVKTKEDIWTLKERRSNDQGIAGSGLGVFGVGTCPYQSYGYGFDNNSADLGLAATCGGCFAQTEAEQFYGDPFYGGGLGNYYGGYGGFYGGGYGGMDGYWYAQTAQDEEPTKEGEEADVKVGDEEESDSDSTSDDDSTSDEESDDEEEVDETLVKVDDEKVADPKDTKEVKEEATTLAQTEGRGGGGGSGGKGSHGGRHGGGRGGGGRHGGSWGGGHHGGNWGGGHHGGHWGGGHHGGHWGGGHHGGHWGGGHHGGHRGGHRGGYGKKW